MNNSQKGYTLVELMVTIAIVAILAAIAIPQYRNYTQRAANGACLGEAQSYMTTAVADASDNMTSLVYNGDACVSGTPTPITPAMYEAADSVVFVPPTRGNAAVLENTRCDAFKGSCSLVP